MPENFLPSLPQIRRLLPAWWAKETGELEKVLRAVAIKVDELSEAFDSVELDASVLTATAEGLQEEYAYVLDLPLLGVESTDREVLQAELNDNGSESDLLRALDALVVEDEISTGTPSVFGVENLLANAGPELDVIGPWVEDDDGVDENTSLTAAANDRFTMTRTGGSSGSVYAYQRLAVDSAVAGDVFSAYAETMPATVERVAVLTIAWFDIANTVINSKSTSLSQSAGVWTPITVANAVAPTGTRRVEVGLYFNDIPDGEEHYWRRVALVDGPTPVPFDQTDLIFPDDGSGITIYEQIIGIPDLVFPADGDPLIFPGDGSPLRFGLGTFFTISVDYNSFEWEVIGRAALTFDRDAVARLMDRHRPAHFLPGTYSEV